MFEAETTIVVYRDDSEDLNHESEIELVIRGQVCQPTPGNRRGHIDTWTPDDGGEVCVDFVGIQCSDKVVRRWTGKLTRQEEDLASEALMSAHADNYGFEPEPPSSGYTAYRDALHDDPYGY